MSEPTWTAKMFDENKALKAKVAAHEYRADYWKSECLELQTKVEELTAALERLSSGTRFIPRPQRYMSQWLPEDYLEEIRQREAYARAALKQEDEDEHDM